MKVSACNYDLNYPYYRPQIGQFSFRNVKHHELSYSEENLSEKEGDQESEKY